MPDVENPNYLALLVDFVKNSIDAAPLAEQKTANLSLRFSGLAGQRAAGGVPVQRVQCFDQLLEPSTTSDGGPLGDPAINAFRIGRRGLSEADLIGHASF